MVHCGEKKGDSVKIEQTSCVNYLSVYEMKVWGVELYTIYYSTATIQMINVVGLIMLIHLLTCKCHIIFVCC